MAVVVVVDFVDADADVVDAADGDTGGADEAPTSVLEWAATTTATATTTTITVLYTIPTNDVFILQRLIIIVIIVIVIVII